MGSELVSPASPLTFTEQFEAQCPFYLSIGMTYDEYWYGSADRVIYYRKAYKMKQKRNNDLAWLNGRYVYDALKAIVPAFNVQERCGQVLSKLESSRFLRRYPQPHIANG